MSLSFDTQLREYISPMDFIGLVRCIAEFEKMDRPEVVLDFDDCIAAVWEKKGTGIMVSGTISRLYTLGPLELLYVAAHEIGHVKVGHLGRRLRRLLTIISRKRYAASEQEADDWAAKYAFSQAWRITYREWDFF